MLKKIISLILAIATSLSITPFVMADEDYGDNLCLGKEAFADGIYQDQHHIFGIQFVNDGNENTQTATGTSMEERSGFQRYVVIDLGEAYNISRVVVRSRRDLDADWARQGFAAYIATKADFSDAVKIGDKNWAGAFKSDLEVDLKTPMKARYIIAAGSDKKSGIVISEIEAYGVSAVGGGKVEYTDITSSAGKNATKVMSAMDIMTGKTDSEFGATDLMTRGEAAMYVCKFAGVPVGEVLEESFLDVPVDHPYAAYIKAGLDYGFISKDTHFRPNDYVFGYEFLKMILCVNGYYEFTKDSLIYPSSIISVANSIDLLEKTDTNGMSYINKLDAAIVMYNAFNKNAYEHKNKELVPTEITLIEKLYGYRLMRGTVTANGITSLEKPFDTVSENRVSINEVEYFDESGEAIKLLGENVYFLVNDDNSIRTLWVDEDRCETVTLYDYQIEDPDFDVIKVEDGAKFKKYRMEDHPYVIYNNAAYSGADESYLTPKNGYLTLIDNNKNGLYDVIKIYEPEIVYVDSVVLDEEYNQIDVSDMSGNSNSYNPDYVSIHNSNGSNAALSSIKQGKLVYFYESKNGKALDVEIQTTSVTGRITKTSGEYIKVDNDEYMISEYFEEKFCPVSLGEDAKFFIDKNGQLIYMVKNRDAESKYVLAVVQMFYVDDGTEEVTFKVYDENKQFRTLTFDDKVTIDGARRSIAEISSLGRSYFEGKLVMLNIIDDTVVNYIITENYADGDVYIRDVSLGGTYRGALGFFSGHKQVLPFTKDIPLFTIPIDTSTGKPGMGVEFDSRYNVRPLSSVYSVGSQVSSGNGVSIYGCDEYGEAKATVAKEYYSTGSLGYGVVGSYNSTGIMLFDSYRLNCNEYGEYYYTLIGYDLTTGGRREITLENGFDVFVNTFKIRNNEWFTDIPSSALPDNSWYKNTFMLYQNKINSHFVENITKLQRGDIIRYANGGYDSVSELEMIAKNMDFDEDKCRVIYYAGHEPTQIIVTQRLQYAIAKEIKDGHIEYAFDSTTNEILNLSGFEGKIIVLKDNTYFESYPISAAGVCIEPGDKLVIYTNAGKHKSIIVYK